MRRLIGHEAKVAAPDCGYEMTHGVAILIPADPQVLRDGSPY